MPVSRFHIVGPFAQSCFPSGENEAENASGNRGAIPTYSRICVPSSRFHRRAVKESLVAANLPSGENTTDFTASRWPDYCYFHLTLRGRALRAAQARRRGQTHEIDLPFPENMHAVQAGLYEVMRGITRHTLNSKDAGLLLYALQQASTNLLQTPDWRGQRQPVEPEQPLLALDFPNFEEQYQIPNDIDLDAEPETALAETEDSFLCHPERGRAEQARVRVEGPAVSFNHDNAVGQPAAAAQDSVPRKKPQRVRGERVPLEKELWEHDDPDAPFRAYTSDGRELTREDAQRWHQRQMQDLLNFARRGDDEEEVA